MGQGALLLAISGLLAMAGACKSSDNVDRWQSGGGLDWGGGGGSSASTEPDPVAIYLGDIAADGMGFPNRVAVGSKGQIAVSDPRAGKVIMLDAAGNRLRSISVPRPMGVAFGADDDLYVGNVADGEVRVYNRRGAYLRSLGAGVGELQFPTDMAWSAETGRLHIADSGASIIVVYDAAGTYVASYGAPGAGTGELSMPTGIALSDATDRVYVGDHGNNRIQVFDRSGTYVKSFGSYGDGDGEFSRIQGLAVDAADRLYVVDTFQGRMQVVDQEGLHVSYLGSFGPKPGQLLQPMDVAIDSFGRLFVTSYGSRKLVSYGIDRYTIPEVEPPAQTVAWIEPPLVKTDRGAKWITLYIEISDGSAAELFGGWVELQGVAPAPGTSFVLGDVDSDGVLDLAATFYRDAIVATLPGPGEHTLAVTGALSYGDPVTGEASLTVIETRSAVHTNAGRRP